jgi:hypothetical protein
MKRRSWAAVGVGVGGCAILAARAGAVNVYVLSSGDATLDSAVVSVLASQGHTATVGVTFPTFDGTQNLSGFQTVYFQANVNWGSGDMPVAGQQALVTWVNGGGRLVTCEWVTWLAATGRLQTLWTILPRVQNSSYSGQNPVTYRQMTADPTINAGLPTSFAFPVDNYGGTEGYAPPRSGATVYYSSESQAGATGLVGWGQGSAGGAVFSISTTCGPTQLADPNFGRLLANVMGAGAHAPCYANCDGSTQTPVLNVNDFVCFQTRFAAANAYADCDMSGTLNVNDFVCFQTRFAAGCP